MSAKKKILIIEDDSDILDIVSAVLNIANFDVTGSNGTNDIFELTKLHQPDLILTDYMLPGLTGGQICKLIKSNEETANIPVVLMSAYHKQAIAIGHFNYDAFVKKPFNIDHLVSVVSKLL
ncbi:hypothetical protein GCM10023149_28590 [Mucilaginibacter gynuensis]|uniref:Response regulatory domain-containing protein n=1 Tax=Mucilaginibacter gynuensis TaxID=1302236 RepID=A0ABP8GKJ0_9SPHI